MAERLTTLPHDFEFTADKRSGLTFSGSIRLNTALREGAGALQLIKDDVLGYPTTGDHYVITELYTPRAVRQWLGFQVDVSHAFDGPDLQLTGDNYRLGDGTDQYYWDGAAWTVSTTDWNTEAEIANNITTFPVAARQIQVVARLTTTDAHYTPIMTTIRIAWKGKVEVFEDIVYRSLVPLLKTVRPIMDFAIKVAMPGGATLNVKSYVAAAGMTLDIVDVEGVFNHNLDPNHYTNLVASYNATTGIATLATPVPVGSVAFCRLVLRAQVSIVATAQDYNEVEAVPAIQIKDFESVNSPQLSVASGVTNKDTGDIIVIAPPYRFNLRFTMIALTPGGVDLMRMLRAVVEMVEENDTILSTATGERYRFWMMEKFSNTTTPRDNNLHTMQAMFEIRDILTFERPATSTKAVGSVNLNTSN